MKGIEETLIGKVFAKIFGKGAPVWPLYVFIVLYLLLEKGPVWVSILSPQRSSPPAVKSGKTTKDTPEDVQQDCTELSPFETYNTKLSYDKIEKRGEYYYPTGSGKTWEGSVWLINVVRPNFKKMYIEYEISSKLTAQKPPTFIWTLARMSGDNKKQEIAKVWTPEYTSTLGVNIPQIVGFAKTSDYSENKLERENSLGLPDPVRNSQSDSLVVEPTSLNGNRMSVNFTYNYTSDRTLIALPFPFSKEFVFPFSDIANSSELLDMGFGTYIGHGLRVVSLKICY